MNAKFSIGSIDSVFDHYRKKNYPTPSKDRGGKYFYFTNCVGLSGSDVDELHKMKDDSIEITWRTFSKHVNPDDVFEIFPDYKSGELKIDDDYAVGFYRSKFKGKRCYFLRHSSIEYIWIER